MEKINIFMIIVHLFANHDLRHSLLLRKNVQQMLIGAFRRMGKR